MAPSPANMYADLLRHDLCAFIHRSFLELNPQTPFLSNWHIEVLAAKLDEVSEATPSGRCSQFFCIQRRTNHKLSGGLSRIGKSRIRIPVASLEYIHNYIEPVLAASDPDRKRDQSRRMEIEF